MTHKYERKRKKKDILPNILLLLVFALGLSLLLYPTVSDKWNAMHQSRAIAEYANSVVKLDTTDYARFLAEAREYNAMLPEKEDRFTMKEEDRAAYDKLLNVTENGIMGYIEIPRLKADYPIYHGTNEAVLQVAIGHVEGSSLPVGGMGTHCVLSGHRGLPSARLFTDLDKMVEGDNFLLYVLGDTLAYEVDQILVVEPHQLQALEIDSGADYCTLVTCTPYGVNTHRMLVRGHRIENLPEETKETRPAIVEVDKENGKDRVFIPLVVVLCVLLVAVVVVIIMVLRAKLRHKR